VGLYELAARLRASPHPNLPLIHVGEVLASGGQKSTDFLATDSRYSHYFPAADSGEALAGCRCWAVEVDCLPVAADDYRHPVARVHFHPAAEADYLRYRPPVVVDDCHHLAVEAGYRWVVADDFRYPVADPVAVDDCRPAVAGGRRRAGEWVGEAASVAVQAAGSESAVRTSDCDRDKTDG
jgi:hypothetical protein